MTREVQTGHFAAVAKCVPNDTVVFTTTPVLPHEMEIGLTVERKKMRADCLLAKSFLYTRETTIKKQGKSDLLSTLYGTRLRLAS